MNSLQLQDQSIFKLLQPLFFKHGYEAVKQGNQFRKKTKNGYRSIMLSLNGQADGQLLELQFGLFYDLIESLVQQYISTSQVEYPGGFTVVVPVQHLKKSPLCQLKVTDKDSLLEKCNEVSHFMQQKGFRFLDAIDRLKLIDARVNRSPELPCLYMNNPVHRCFKGLVIARLLQRNDFENLTQVYRGVLTKHEDARELLDNYDRLVNYLKCFSFN